MGVIEELNNISVELAKNRFAHNRVRKFVRDKSFIRNDFYNDFNGDSIIFCMGDSIETADLVFYPSSDFSQWPIQIGNIIKFSEYKHIEGEYRMIKYLSNTTGSLTIQVERI